MVRRRQLLLGRGVDRAHRTTFDALDHQPALLHGRAVDDTFVPLQAKYRSPLDEPCVLSRGDRAGDLSPASGCFLDGQEPACLTSHDLGLLDQIGMWILCRPPT